MTQLARQEDSKVARLPGTPRFAPGVNRAAPDADLHEALAPASVPAQVASQATLAMKEAGDREAAENDPAVGAGERAVRNPVNHTQVVAPQGTLNETQQLLAHIGVNLQAAQVGRKHVFDEFMRGRLVSLLALGLSIRQAGAALGLSHTAVWKELRRNPELGEQVNAARFQAQVEPLLVILRESKRSWRAATWLMNYLSKSIAQHEETPNERTDRMRDETEAFFTRSREFREKEKKEAEEKKWREEYPEVVRDVHRRERQKLKQREKRVQLKAAQALAAASAGEEPASNGARELDAAALTAAGT